MEGVEIGNLQIPAIKGEKGDTGAAGKISSLTITMLESTATPTVTNTGTIYDANYVLGIPRGTGISTAGINESGELVITLTDNTELNLGQVVGTSITNVELDNNYDLVITLSDETEITAGHLDIANMITNASLNGEDLKFTKYNGSLITVSLHGLLMNYQEVIDSNNKLNADLVDDTNSTNKFVTSAEKTTWNSKASTSDIPTKTSDLTNDSGFLTGTDYATDNTGGVIKTGNYIELDSNKRLQQTTTFSTLGLSGTTYDKYLCSVNNAKGVVFAKTETSITSSSTNNKVAGAKAVYDYVTSVVGGINAVLDDINGEVV